MREHSVHGGLAKDDSQRFSTILNDLNRPAFRDPEPLRELFV
jgi:hypothetical protein